MNKYKWPIASALGLAAALGAYRYMGSSSGKRTREALAKTTRLLRGRPGTNLASKMPNAKQMPEHLFGLSCVAP